MKKIISLLLVGVLFISFAFAMAEEFKDEGVNELVKQLDEGEYEVFSYELDIVKIDGVSMVHLRPVLEAFEYDVIYNDDTKLVEIINGPYYTTLKEGENAYYKHKMAPRELTSAPTILAGKMYVPIEFLPTMTDIGLKLEEATLFAYDENIAIHSGYIGEIEETERGQKITLTDESLEFDMNTSTIIHIGEGTILNCKLKVGTLVEVISPPVMTMSLPAQTGAIVIFEIK
ncbi:MAG: stalk domain-containing protein [Clostridia bacterium]